MNRHLGRRDLRSGLAVALATVLVVVGGCAPGTDETARARGDLAFARDSLELALAEYRLAVRQGSDDGPSLARVAHTYVRLGRVDEARDWYERAVGADPAFADQAAADLLNLARDAATRRDRFQMASAMDAGMYFRPGMSVEAMALPMARHYFENGEYGRALPFYEKAMAVSGDSVPELILEIGEAHQEIGDCRRALVYFERFREMVRPWERSEVDWYIGSCSYRLASEILAQEPRGSEGAGGSNADRSDSDTGARPSDRARGRRDDGPGGVETDRVAPMDRVGGGGGYPDLSEETLEEALALVQRTIEVGEPRNLVGQAWFERGEILSRLGDCDGALAAMEEVVRAEPSATTALARRAQQRFDQIKFGRGLERLRPGRGCG